MTVDGLRTVDGIAADGLMHFNGMLVDGLIHLNGSGMAGLQIEPTNKCYIQIHSYLECKSGLQNVVDVLKGNFDW